MGTLGQPGGGGATRWRRSSVLVTGAVAVLLLVEGFALRSPFEPTARGIDDSVKRVQTLALEQSGLRRQVIPYRAEYLDPQRWYVPFVRPFVMRTRTGLQAIFPTVAALVDIPSEWVGGAALLRLISTAAVLLAVVLTLRITGGRIDSLAPAVLVFATPLWFYALGGTSHPVALVLSTAAMAAALDHGRSLAAGALLGVAAMLRDESLALLPGLVVVSAWRWRSGWHVARLLSGLAIPLVLMAAVDQVVYGRPAAAHLIHAVGVLPLSDVPTAGVQVLESMTWRDRLDVVFVYWLDGRSLTHLGVLASAVAGAALVRRRTGSYIGVLPALAIVLVDAGTDVWAAVDGPRRLPGLLRLAPFLIFAVLPWANTTEEERRRRRVALGIAAAYLLVAAATTNTSGGKPLGPRLLLPIWPLLAATAWQGVRGHLRAVGPPVVQRLVAAGGVALVLAGVFFTVRIMSPYRDADRRSTAAARYVAGTTEEVIVIGSPFAIDPVIAVYPARSVMLVSSEADVEAIDTRLSNARVRRLLFVRRNSHEDISPAFPAYDRSREVTFGQWTVQHWTLR